VSKVIIFGTGPFAEIVYFYLTHDSPHEVIGFTANKVFIKENMFFGLPVIPFEDIENFFSPDEVSMFVSVGYKNMNKDRAKICDYVKQKGYALISYVNSKATTWDDLSIGENCFILENNVIQPFVKIGNNVIIWSGNHIGHHSIIDDHCFISSHVVISGFVKIGSHCFFGVNSTIRDSINIESECIIGAGSLILENTKFQGVYTTNPATLKQSSSNKLTHF